MRKYLWVITLLLFAPCSEADTFQVTSGYFQPWGGTTNDFVLSGDGWSATLNVNFFTCVGNFRPGDPIFGCGDTLYLVGYGILIENGVTQPSIAIDTFVEILQDPIFLSGATQATLTEPVTFGGVTGCFAVFANPCQPSERVVFDIGPALYTVSVTKDPFYGYVVSSERYTFTGPVSTPEPGSGVLLLSGVGLFGLMMRKRIARGLPQVT
jgi:hypothetical protein